MTVMKGCRRCIWLGLLFSAFIHAAIAAALLRAGTTPTPNAPEDRVVSLDLAMFGAEDGAPTTPGARETSTPGMTVAQSDQTTVQEQSLEPELETSQDENQMPEPEQDSEAKTTLEPAPLPALSKPVAIAPVEQTANSASKPRTPARPRKSVAPTPKPVSKPLPKPKPKPTVTPSFRAKTPATITADARPRASRDKRPRSESVSPTEGAAQSPTQGQGGSGTGGSAVAGDTSERDYLIALQQAIARHQKYPMEARRREQTGIATVAFVVREDGRLDQIRLATSSGEPALDRAALDAMRQLGRFKPIPLSIGRQSWPLRVPIRFALK